MCIRDRQYDKLPSEIGVIVNNSTTAIAVHDALVEGSPIVSRIVTVSGNAVKNLSLIHIFVKPSAYAPEIAKVMQQIVATAFPNKEAILFLGGHNIKVNKCPDDNH